MSSSLYDIVERFTLDPRRYWPDDSYFHRRNRQKHSGALQRLQQSGTRGRGNLVERFVELARKRSESGTPTLYAMSNGGSGSHYLGELLDGLDGFSLTDEIYFPPLLLEEIEKSSDAEAVLAIDFVNYFHVGSVSDLVEELVVVNIGHLRPDVSPSHLARYDRSARFALLLRNPFDIAISRAFRKEDYRKQVAPDMSDAEYLQRQVNGTKTFFSRVQNHAWDRIVRYEHLVADPSGVVGDLVREMGRPLDAGSLFEVVRRYDRTRGQGNAAPASTNLNPEPREVLAAESLEILSALDGVATDFGYDEPEVVTRSRALLASSQ